MERCVRAIYRVVFLHTTVFACHRMLLYLTVSYPQMCLSEESHFPFKSHFLLLAHFSSAWKSEYFEDQVLSSDF